ncbi:MAG: hypothetical protein ACE5KV_07410 [Thermoplasmata archaeon]
MPIMVILALIFGAWIVSLPTAIADIEPNDDFLNAELITPGSHAGGLNSTDTEDYYKIATVADEQTVSATVNVGSTLTVNIYLYNESQVEVDSNLSVTNGYGFVFHTFATIETAYIRIQQVSGEGSYLLSVFLRDDIIPPNITHTPVASALVGQPITITANVTDNKAVNVACLNYTDVTGVTFNETMTMVDGNYSYDIPAQPSPGSVEYFIWANDTYGNWNMTANHTITIEGDADPPTIAHEAVTSAGMGETITITANVTDNVEVDEVWLNYTDTAGEDHNVTMTIVEGNYSYDIPAQASVGTVSYFIWANDTFNNTNRTPVYEITITDTEAPEITHTPVTEATAGEPVEISAAITDNVGVDSATLYYRKKGETDYTSLGMTKSDDTYSATIPGSEVTTEGVEYYISATDGVNTATYPATSPDTSPREITVTAAVAPGPEIPWIWIIIAIVIIIVIVVVVIVAAKRRGPSMPEEEEVPPSEEGGKE